MPDTIESKRMTRENYELPYVNKSDTYLKLTNFLRDNLLQPTKNNLYMDRWPEYSIPIKNN